MMNRRTAIAAFASVASTAALGFTTFIAPMAEAAAGDPLAIVVAKDSPLSDIPLYQLKQIFMGANQQTPDGKRFLPLNRGPKTPERVGFDQHALGMNPDAAMRFWLDQRTRGLPGSPKAIDPAPVLQQLVGKLPGAIAYVRAKEVDASVKVLKVDGKKPTDAGYALRSLP